MSARTTFVYLTAGWRESARARDPYIDVDHLLIGLLATGGPAAQLLTRHGLDLASARKAAAAVHADAIAVLGVDVHALPVPAPRAIDELHRDNVGEMPMAERAGHLVDSLGPRATERDLLRALLAEPSGTIRDLIERCGADPAAIMGDVEHPTNWTTPTPRRSRILEAKAAHQTAAAVELEHFIPADLRLVRAVATDISLAPQWLMLPDTTRQEDRTLTVTSTKRGRTSTLRLALLTDEEDQVRWIEWWDDRAGGWYDVRLAPVDGGTMVTLARAIRPIGVLGAALAPWIRLTNGLGLLVRAQNLSLACAEAGGDQGQR